MESSKVKDLMVPLDQYAIVSENASLYEAVLALDEAQAKYEVRGFKHRAVLVADSNKKIVGKLSQLEIIRGLEPKYLEIGDVGMLSRFGFKPEFIKSIIKDSVFLQKPLDDVCRKAAQIRVKNIMHVPSENEYIDEDSSLNKAIHKLVMGMFQSLLVTREGEIVGILRMSDVYGEVCTRIKACRL